MIKLLTSGKGGGVGEVDDVHMCVGVSASLLAVPTLRTLLRLENLIHPYLSVDHRQPVSGDL